MHGALPARGPCAHSPRLALRLPGCRSWQDDLSAAQGSTDIGLLCVSASDMQASLAGVLEDAMAVLRAMLTAAAHHQVLGALDSFQSLST